MSSEQTDFLKDLEIDNTNVLDQQLTEEVATEEVDTETEQHAKNRRERRLLEKNQQLREEAIALSSRLQGINESKNLRETTEEADYLKRVEKIYGTATPEATEATNLLKEALRGVHESARKEAEENAFKRFIDQKDSEAQALKENENTIQEGLDRLEDDRNADFSNPQSRKGFLTLLERLSPKDRDGNIIEYADFDTTYELYQTVKDRSSNRAKDLASRSMTHSGGGDSKLEISSQERFLRENGII